MKAWLRGLAPWVLAPVELLLLPLLAALALASRAFPKASQVGLGPEPLINNVYHRQALELAGYRADTFTWAPTFITSAFDLDASSWRRVPLLGALVPLALFVRSLFRHQALLIYFRGGPLYPYGLLAAAEPWLLKLAGIKVLVLPYGSDVQVMTRSPNLLFKHAMASDYPAVSLDHVGVARRVDRWSQHGDWVLGGCEWVDYMPRWDALMSGHFCIEAQAWQAPAGSPPPGARPGPLRVLHAPNHKNIKGTAAFLAACEAVKAEGFELEVILLQGVPNHRIREAMQEADLVADQFVIGWYAMFAIEAMAMGKPVLCHLRPDLLRFFEDAGVLAPGELPLLPTSLSSLTERLRWACTHRQALAEAGARGPAFVAAHHSLERLASVFGGALAGLGIQPQGQPRVPADPLAGWPGAPGLVGPRAPMAFASPAREALLQAEAAPR